MTSDLQWSKSRFEGVVTRGGRRGGAQLSRDEFFRKAGASSEAIGVLNRLSLATKKCSGFSYRRSIVST